MPTETLRCWVIKKLLPKSIAEKMCPETMIGEGTCWKCRVKIPFMIPRRGYSNGYGRCCECGSVYTMLSNYGLVTLFPSGVVESYMDGVRLQAGFITTEEEG